VDLGPAQRASSYRNMHLKLQARKATLAPPRVRARRDCRVVLPSSPGAGRLPNDAAAAVPDAPVAVAVPGTGGHAAAVIVVNAPVPRVCTSAKHRHRRSSSSSLARYSYHSTSRGHGHEGPQCRALPRHRGPRVELGTHSSPGNISSEPHEQLRAHLNGREGGRNRLRDIGRHAAAPIKGRREIHTFTTSL
jgi:hypothetical protein